MLTLLKKLFKPVNPTVPLKDKAVKIILSDRNDTKSNDTSLEKSE